MNKRDIDFLYEIGNIRFIDRMWRRFGGVDFANLAEHHFRVAWIALIIAKHEGVEDTDKVLKMAIIHDIAESRAGDVDMLSRQYVDRNEELGIKDILVGTEFEQEMYDIWEEYEKRESIEAKVVKDADNLDVDFEVHERLDSGNQVAKKINEKIRPPVRKNKLYTDTAKKMWDALQSHDPHDWHFNSRNRVNSGDWKT